jgi:hypothetical protein
MSSVNPLQLLRSSTANKRPLPAGLVDGRPAINTNSASPGLFFKDSTGGLVKVGPVHVGTTAPNVSPASGGATGNSVGEQWLDTTGGTYVLKIWDGSAWRSESGTFVDVNGDVMTGALVMDNQQQVRFRETTANGTNYIALQGPASVASDKTITLPDVNGTIVTTGDSETVTSTMIRNDTIVNADINSSAAIAGTKISPDFGSQTVQTTGVVSHALGTAGAPTLTFTGDTNTGIYSPGADQVAVATNGTGRLFVDASGNVNVDSNTFYVDAVNNRVAIGIDTPLQLLHLSSASAPITQITYQGVGAAQTGVVAGGAYTIGVDGGNGSTERLRITSAGLVGVGTSSPSQRLHVVGTVQSLSTSTTVADNVGFFAGNGGDASLLNGITFQGGYSTNMYFGRGALTDSLVVRNNSAELFRITSAGAVGVGTTSPGSPLTIESNAGNQVKITYPSIASYFLNATSGGDFAINKDGTERLRIDSSGNVGIGTSSPGEKLDVYAGSLSVGSHYVATTSTDYKIRLRSVGPNTNNNYTAEIGVAGSGPQPADSDLTFATQTWNGSAYVTTEKARLTATGRLGIGTTIPATNLEVRGGGAGVDAITTISSIQNGAFVRFAPAGSNAIRQYTIGSAVGGSLIFYDDTANSQRAAIDSSGRLLVGTSSNLTSDPVQISFSQADSLGGLSITNQQWYGYGARILFQSKNNSAGDIKTLGAITGEGDGVDKGRLVFSTTADGASSPTRRVVMRNNGWVVFGQDTENGDAVGIGMDTPNGTMYINSFNTTTLQVGRISTDGTLISFRHENTEEGSISISGTTVSYNGAHLSRWSQLPGGAERTEILRGSVLSNIDEMCEWGDEDNEQLNRMKVSDVEGDKNVSGVFQGWDDDDDTYTNDFYCAMTGDFIIRIAQGVTVERGDLLMSAGDGTAKPQDDDIIRSKTIAKVTSTNVCCTYEDGSYCVPCVLMAC